MEMSPALLALGISSFSKSRLKCRMIEHLDDNLPSVKVHPSSQVGFERYCIRADNGVRPDNLKSSLPHRLIEPFD